MCGIVGVVALNSQSISPDLVQTMNECITHRGPDEAGFWVQGGVGLAMRRLAIIDLKSGQQPICNEDETVRIVFNGEIYNFPELRVELEAKGHKFRTHSDTETIVHAYEEWAEDCPQHLRGMFAFAIYDARDDSLFIARDRLGKKTAALYNSRQQISVRFRVHGAFVVPRCRAQTEFGRHRKVSDDELHSRATHGFRGHPQIAARALDDCQEWRDYIAALLGFGAVFRA